MLLPKIKLSYLVSDYLFICLFFHEYDANVYFNSIPLFRNVYVYDRPQMMSLNLGLFQYSVPLSCRISSLMMLRILQEIHVSRKKIKYVAVFHGEFETKTIAI